MVNLSHVRIQSENGERKERLLLLFPSVLVMLSVSTRMSGYQYEVRPRHPANTTVTLPLATTLRPQKKGVITKRSQNGFKVVPMWFSVVANLLATILVIKKLQLLN